MICAQGGWSSPSTSACRPILPIMSPIRRDALERQKVKAFRDWLFAEAELSRLIAAKLPEATLRCRI